jgi:hypothetical protein
MPLPSAPTPRTRSGTTGPTQSCFVPATVSVRALVTEATDYYTDMAATAAQQLGAKHPDTLTTRANLAYWRGTAGDAKSAASAFEELLTDCLHVLGPEHPQTLATRANLAYWRGGV